MRTPSNEKLTIKAIVHDLKAAKVVMMGVPDIPGIAARLFTSLAERGVGAEMIIQNNMRGGTNDIGFLVRKERLDEAIDVCRDFSREVDAQGVSFNTEIARVSVIGTDMSGHLDIPSRMFSTLAKEGINIDMISSTVLDVTCVVASSRIDDAVRALREHFIEENTI
jgi:aspartate kinase